jgi:hypothetical protein
MDDPVLILSNRTTSDGKFKLDVVELRWHNIPHRPAISSTSQGSPNEIQLEAARLTPGLSADPIDIDWSRPRKPRSTLDKLRYRVGRSQHPRNPYGKTEFACKEALMMHRADVRAQREFFDRRGMFEHMMAERRRKDELEKWKAQKSLLGFEKLYPPYYRSLMEEDAHILLRN